MDKMSVLDKTNKSKLFDVECTVTGMIGTSSVFSSHTKNAGDASELYHLVGEVSTLNSLNNIIKTINAIVGRLVVNKAKYTVDYTGTNGVRYITISFCSYERDFMACREIDKNVVSFDFQLDPNQEEAFRTLVSGAFPYKIEAYNGRISQW